MRTLTLAFSTLLLTTLAASAQPAKAGGGKPSPCALVTKAEVQEVFGAPAADPKPNQHNSSVCDFLVGGTSPVGVMIAELRPGETMEKTIAELKKRNIPAQPLSSLGDSAYFASPGYGMQQLSVYKGTRFFILTALIPGAPEAKVRGMLQSLAKKALPRL